VFKGDKALSVSTVSFVVFSCLLFRDIPYFVVIHATRSFFRSTLVPYVSPLSFSSSIQRQLASRFVYSCLATDRPLLRFVFIDMHLDFILADVRSRRAGTIHSSRGFIETIEVANHKEYKKLWK
jgi:hypothetical protein